MFYPPLEGEGRSKAPGWGDLRHAQLTMMFAVVTPTRRAAATSPLKGEVEFPLLPSGEKVPEGRMRGRFGIEGQGQAFHRCVFPISVCPGFLLQGGFAPPHPALRATFSPRGRRGSLRSPQHLRPRPEKSAVGLLHADLAGALESAGAKLFYMTPSGAPFSVFCRASQVLLRFPF